MTSRLIVKNLPLKISEDELKRHFEPYGNVTDVALKRKPNGAFRGFAFIGFQSEEEGKNAKESLNNSYFRSSKMIIEYVNTISSDSIKASEKINPKSSSTKESDLSFLKSKTTESTEECIVSSVKLTGAPASCTKKDVRTFFGCQSITRIRILKKSKIPAFVVSFDSPTDYKLAQDKNGTMLNGSRVEVKAVDTVKAPAKQLEIETTQVNDSEDIIDTGRLFVKNLAFCCTEELLESHLKTFGDVVETHLPIDDVTHKPMGFAFVTFLLPENALKAYMSLNGSSFMGRTLHILPGKEKKVKVPKVVPERASSYQKKASEERKSMSTNDYNWNTLFIGSNAVVDALSAKYGRKKNEIVSNEGKQSLPVRIALGETKLVMETKDFLVGHGVNLDAFSQGVGKRSKTIMIAKNLPVGVTEDELLTLFSKHGTVDRIILPPMGITSLVIMRNQQDAKNVFLKLAYTKYKDLPLYLEWAPVDCIQLDSKPKVSETSATEQNLPESNITDKVAAEEFSDSCVLYIKNLNFRTTEEDLKGLFTDYSERIVSVLIAKSKDKSGVFLSRGYGFIELRDRNTAQDVLKSKQHCQLDGHTLELKISNRGSLVPKSQKTKQTGAESDVSTCKVLVKNIPFEVTQKEIKELFSTFGEVKLTRLPLQPGGRHRGFGFVEFHSVAEAKKAFESLCQSTHILGRRLVLQWAQDDESVDDMRKRTADKFFLGQSSNGSKRVKLSEEDIEMQ